MRSNCSCGKAARLGRQVYRRCSTYSTNAPSLIWLSSQFYWDDFEHELLLKFVQLKPQHTSIPVWPTLKSNLLTAGCYNCANHMSEPLFALDFVRTLTPMSTDEAEISEADFGGRVTEAAYAFEILVAPMFGCWWQQRHYCHENYSVLRRLHFSDIFLWKRKNILSRRKRGKE